MDNSFSTKNVTIICVDYSYSLLIQSLLISNNKIMKIIPSVTCTLKFLILRTCTSTKIPSSVDLVTVQVVTRPGRNVDRAPVADSRTLAKSLGPNSIDFFCHEFWLEKSLVFWLEIQMFKIG